jgi:hypothetical protein
MGILGRRRAPKPPEASPDGLALLQRQLANPDAALRSLAEEAKGVGTTNPCRHCGKPAGSRCDCTNHPPRCRYCGRISAFGWSMLICERCERVRTRIEAGAMSHFSIAERRGLNGPPTIGDDELLVTFTRRLRDADYRRVELDEKDERRARREGKTRSWHSGIKPGAGGQDNPQKSSGLGDDPRDDFAEPTAEAA